MARGQKRPLSPADDSASKSRRLFSSHFISRRPPNPTPAPRESPSIHTSSLINGGAVSPAAPRGATLKGKNGHPRTDVSAPRSLPPASDRQSGTSTLTRAATFRAGISLELFPLGQSSTSHGASTSRLVPDPNRPTFLPPPRDAALNDLSRAVQKKKAAPRGPLFAESSFPAVRAAPRTELTALRWDLDHAPRPPASARSSSSMAGPTPALNSRTWPDSTTAEPGRQRAASVRVPRRQTANALETSTSRPVTHRPRSAAHPYRADGHRASRAFSPLLLPVSASTPADDAIESWDDELEEMNTRLDDVLSPPFAPASPRPYPTAAPSRPSASTRAEDDAIGYFEDEMDEMERRLYDVLSSPSPEPTMARPLPRSPSRSSVRQGGTSSAPPSASVQNAASLTVTRNSITSHQEKQPLTPKKKRAPSFPSHPLPSSPSSPTLYIPRMQRPLTRTTPKHTPSSSTRSFPAAENVQSRFATHHGPPHEDTNAPLRAPAATRTLLPDQATARAIVLPKRKTESKKRERMNAPPRTVASDAERVLMTTLHIPLHRVGPAPTLPKFYAQAHARARLDPDPESGEFLVSLMTSRGVTEADFLKDPRAALLQLADPLLGEDSISIAYGRILQMRKSFLARFRHEVETDDAFRASWFEKTKRLFAYLAGLPGDVVWLIYFGQTRFSLLDRHSHGDSHFWGLLRKKADSLDEITILGLPIVSTAGTTQIRADGAERGLMSLIGLDHVANCILLGIGSPMILHRGLENLAAQMQDGTQMKGLFVLDSSSFTAEDQLRSKSFTDILHVCRVTGAFNGADLDVLDINGIGMSNGPGPLPPNVIIIIIVIIRTIKFIVIMGGCADNTFFAALTALASVNVISKEDLARIEKMEWGDVISVLIDGFLVWILLTYHVARGFYLGLQSLVHADLQSFVGASLTKLEAFVRGADKHRAVIDQCNAILDQLRPSLNPPKRRNGARLARQGNGITEEDWRREGLDVTFAEWCTQRIYCDRWLGEEDKLDALVDRLIAWDGSGDWSPLHYVGHYTLLARDAPNPPYLDVNKVKNKKGGLKGQMIQSNVGHARPFQWWFPEHIPFDKFTTARCVVDRPRIILLAENDEVIDARPLRNAWMRWKTLRPLLEVALLLRLVTADDDMELPPPPAAQLTLTQMARR